jgi:CRP-like cAMP-binding protein
VTWNFSVPSRGPRGRNVFQCFRPLPRQGGRVDLGAGEIFSELGLLNAGQARTASVECTASGELLRIGYEQVKQICVQDPKFSFYFLHLVSKRLLCNLSLVEQAAPSE